MIELEAQAHRAGKSFSSGTLATGATVSSVRSLFQQLLSGVALRLLQLHSPPKVVDRDGSMIASAPDEAHISTSIIDRQNFTMPTSTSMRQFTRLTNGFSKKLENMKALGSRHFVHMHKTLRMTPAIAASVEKSTWSRQNLGEPNSR